MPKGKVYLIGAGPGDIELITLKGYKLIGRADVILHDYFIPHELLQLTRPEAEIISVGKFAKSTYNATGPDKPIYDYTSVVKFKNTIHTQYLQRC
ncbi:MAG: SAM-dependent methyltransferase [Planctomycetota bacterium]